MSSGSCGKATRQPVEELTQIRQGFTVAWNHLVLAVETSGQQWTASVLDPAGRGKLYTAHRCSAQAAKTAAVEFAAFQTAQAGRLESPELVAKRLPWNPKFAFNGADAGAVASAVGR